LIEQKKYSLYLFTIEFPFGKGETFIENELIFLSKEFLEIKIFPLKGNGEIKRLLPDNAQVINLFQNYSGLKSKPVDYLYAFFKMIPVFYLSHKKNKFLKNWFYLYSYLRSIINKKNILTNWISNNKTNSHVIFYSYWFDEWVSILCFLKKEKKINNLFSRTHGFDLYENRNSLGFIPFRKIQLKYCDKIFSVSNAGHNYLINQYPQFTSKFSTQYLGVKYQFKLPIKRSDQFTVVSCSNIISLKRVDLIASVLLKLNFPTKWTHFGEGPEFDELKKIMFNNKNINLTYDFRGSINNNELMSFYSKNHVDLFINLSVSEGIPVSIMEAISFGIPVLATNVGGTSEIVNQTTGILIDTNTSISEIVQIITNIKNQKVLFDSEKIKFFFNENFNAEKNYCQFINELKAII
jgi:glycosyltransferase involved in cell wall biosynthesis